MCFVTTNEKCGIFQYQTGLNISNDSTICFSDTKYIDHYYYDAWIRPIVLPYNAKIKIINGYTRKYIYTDKIILGDRYPIYSLKTIKKFNFKLTSEYINQVCKKGKMDILEWWKNSGLELKYDKDALEYASRNGHVNVLEWWKNSGLELKYDKYALNFASFRGQVEVLEWWKNSGLELKYDASALDWASRLGQVEVLEWWKNTLKLH